MLHQPHRLPEPRSSVLPLLTAAWSATVFVADSLTPPEWFVSGLYVLVVLMAGRFCHARALWATAGGCAIMTLIAQILAHRFAAGSYQAPYSGSFNTAVAMFTIGSVTYLVRRGQSAEAALQRAQTDLAHVSRVTTMGELTAAIAHEVNQPIAAVVTNANASLRWLAGDTPNLEMAKAAATRIVRDGTRAADIIGRIRQTFTRGMPTRDRVNINQVLRETAELLGNEGARYFIAIRLDLAANLPDVVADRIQIQQVLVNLMINGIEAMRDVPGPRDLIVKSMNSEAGQIIISVSDTGVGLPPQPPDQMFSAFFTTKPDGTGMGLSISRSIIESHDGKLWALPNAPKGAIFLFNLPVQTNGVSDFG